MDSSAPPLVAFRSVRAVDPQLGLDAVVDAVLEHGVLTRLGPGAAESLEKAEQVRVLDAQGCWLLPGLVEVHAHLREPGFEYKEDIESGLRAAAAGGYVHVCAMPNTRPTIDSPELVRRVLARGKELRGTQLHVIGAVTAGLKGEQLADLRSLRAAGAVGFSDDGRCVLSGALLRKAFEITRELDVPLIQHAEDHSMTETALLHEGEVSQSLGLPGWPRDAEDSVVARDLVLAQSAGAHYHVAHVSTRGTVQLLREAKRRGLQVSAEVAPHHLLLTHEELRSRDPIFKVNPPLRDAEDRQAVREGLADGTLDCVATDHAPHSNEEKRLPLERAPSGMIGMETCLAVMVGLVEQGVLTLPRLLEALTTAPSRLIGIKPPSLRVGALADLCLFDPRPTYTLTASLLHSKSTNTPLLGRQLKGRVALCVAQGVIAFDALASLSPL